MDLAGAGHSEIVGATLAIFTPQLSDRGPRAGAGADAGDRDQLGDGSTEIAGVVTEIPDFASLYEAQFDFVWRSVRRLGVPERSLDDAVQDVFIVVHRRLAAFEGRSTIKSWLFGIARRVASDHRRRIDRKERTEELPVSCIDPLAPDPRAEAERSAAFAVLSSLLQNLDDDKREVFMLVELEEMSVPEVADAIGINLNTVYSRLRAARRDFDAAVARHHARERSGQ